MWHASCACGPAAARGSLGAWHARCVPAARRQTTTPPPMMPCAAALSRALPLCMPTMMVATATGYPWGRRAARQCARGALALAACSPLHLLRVRALGPSQLAHCTLLIEYWSAVWRLLASHRVLRARTNARCAAVRAPACACARMRCAPTACARSSLPPTPAPCCGVDNMHALFSALYSCQKEQLDRMGLREGWVWRRGGGAHPPLLTPRSCPRARGAGGVQCTGRSIRFTSHR